MARKVRTRAQLRTEAYQRADLEGAVAYIDQAEADRYINSSIADLYDLLIQYFGPEPYLATQTITLTGATEYNLDDEFYLLKGVDAVEGSNNYPLLPYDFEDRHRSAYEYFHYPHPNSSLRYRLLGTLTDATGVYQPKIRFTPTEATGTVTVWYIPRAPDLGDDTDSWDGFNGWEEYVVVDAAIKMLEKEESDTSSLMQRKMLLIERIRTMAAMYNGHHPEVVSDIEGWTW